MTNSAAHARGVLSLLETVSRPTPMFALTTMTNVRSPSEHLVLTQRRYQDGIIARYQRIA